MPTVIRTPAVTYDALTEAELVTRAQAGEREAFAAIMQRCNQPLFRVARAIMHDDAEAEDVLQESYMRAFAKLDGFRGEAGILTWLTRITLNEAKGRLRRRRANVGVDQIDTAQSAGALLLAFPSGEPADSPEAAAARAEMRRLIERAVDELPEGFRLVFILRDVDDRTIEDTAAILGLKPETVKSRLHRARRLLRQALDQKLASTLTDAFPFLGRRCERITTCVLGRLAARHGWALCP